jgi:hypothetical protein
MFQLIYFRRRYRTTVPAWSKAWTVFALFYTEIVGSNTTEAKDVCKRLFCVCVVQYVVADLRRADPPSKETTDYALD